MYTKYVHLSLAIPPIFKEIIMNVTFRLFFVLVGIVGLAIFAWGFTSSGKLSNGQSLMLWSTVPVSVMMLVGACHTQKNSIDVIAIMVMLVGFFFGIIPNPGLVFLHNIFQIFIIWSNSRSK
jgi:hypothetical protein